MEQVKKADEQQQLERRPQNEANFPVVDLSAAELPDLRNAEVLPIELTTLYWTPEQVGETKRVYFDCIAFKEMPALEGGTGEAGRILPCAFFFEQTDEGVVRLCNASARLVGALEGNFVKRGTPLIIIYKGKVKNSTNAFKSDSWSIQPLNPKAALIAEKVSETVNQNANQQEIGIKETKVTGPGF